MGTGWGNAPEGLEEGEEIEGSKEFSTERHVALGATGQLKVSKMAKMSKVSAANLEGFDGRGRPSY